MVHGDVKDISVTSPGPLVVARGEDCVACVYGVHFDHAPAHHSQLVTEKLIEEGLKRMPRPAYSPYGWPCDFFLFGYLNDNLIDKVSRTPAELLSEVETTISEIPSDKISGVFLPSQEKVRKCVEIQGNDVE
jgi:hypothetical protein